MNQALIDKKFEAYLRSRSLKLTPQRRRIFERAFSTHQHFSAERLYSWMGEEDGPRVSRATVYRTLALLEDGGFVESLDTGGGELVYEHVLGHGHHDHLICTRCGRIIEFDCAMIESAQERIAKSYDFQVLRHRHELYGHCANCRDDR